MPTPTIPPGAIAPAGDLMSLANLVMSLHRAEPFRLDGAEAAIVPNGMTLHSLKNLRDQWLPKPERRNGTAELGDLASFIAHANRFKSTASAVFAQRNEEKPGLLSVLDYHPEGGASTETDWCHHRGRYAFPLSEQWKAWAQADGAWLGQKAFAEFVEERILDVLPPPKDGRDDASALALDLVTTLGGEFAGPSRLLEVSRGLRVTETAEVANVTNLASGEVEVVFRTTHTGAAGQKLSVPNLFLVGVPVFDGDAAYKLPIRLRYRRVDGHIVWQVARYRPDIVFFDAFDRATARVREETGLPVFIGTPEGSRS